MARQGIIELKLRGGIKATKGQMMDQDRMEGMLELTIFCRLKSFQHGALVGLVGFFVIDNL